MHGSENTAGYDSAKCQKYISIKGDGSGTTMETATASIPQKELVTKVRTAMTTKIIVPVFWHSYTEHTG